MMDPNLFGFGTAPSSFAVTLFEDYAATTKREVSLSLDALAEMVRSTSAATKDELPWLKLARFGSLPNPKTNSGSLRWDGNVSRISGAVADYDAEEITPREAADRLDKAGVAGLIYTSPSHMRDGHGPRWRVVSPFSEELLPNDHYRMIARLNGLFGGQLAPESFTLSQCYFYGRIDGSPVRDVIISDGTTALDQCPELDRGAIGKPNGRDRHEAGAEPQAPIEDIRAALAIIPNPVPSWGPQACWVEWNNFGMAVWRASGGSQEGFEAFDEWSRKSEKYDAEETEFRWRHFFQSPPDAIGFGSLVFWVHETEPGWVAPSKRRKEPEKEPLWTVTRSSEWVGRDVGPREWVLEDWLPLGEYVALYGLKGVRKTDFILQALMAGSIGEFSAVSRCGTASPTASSARTAKRRLFAASIALPPSTAAPVPILPGFIRRVCLVYSIPNSLISTPAEPRQHSRSNYSKARWPNTAPSSPSSIQSLIFTAARKSNGGKSRSSCGF
jgi:hypothetical protein